MSKHPGKKIGTLEVKLDRKKTRYKYASVEVELRFEIKSGMFWAQYESHWYSAQTKDTLAEQIKTAASKALSLAWKRYIQINYEAEGWPIEDEKTGRPAARNYQTYEIGDERSKFDDKDDKHVICAIKLHWSLCEISEPYALPEDPRKHVRSKRCIGIHSWGPDTGKEQIGDPQEWEDDVLPLATLLWTPEREAVLAEIVTALGKLDARLLELFTGDTAALAAKIDAAAQTDPSRLLVAPTDPAPTKRRRA